MLGRVEKRVITTRKRVDEALSWLLINLILSLVGRLIPHTQARPRPLLLGDLRDATQLRVTSWVNLLKRGCVSNIVRKGDRMISTAFRWKPFYTPVTPD